MVALLCTGVVFELWAAWFWISSLDFCNDVVCVWPNADVDFLLGKALILAYLRGETERGGCRGFASFCALLLLSETQ